MRGQLIPEVRLQLFHTTCTGNNFENVISFLRQGVRSDIAHGFGQGKGFYVWTTLKKAIEHVGFQRGDGTVIGYPMIIELEESIDPENWDLDYESNAHFLTAFLRGHWKTFKKIPDGEIEVNGSTLIVSECKMNIMTKFHIFGGNVSLALKDKKNDKTLFIATTETKLQRGADNTEEAAALGMIFNYFQTHYPHETMNFEMAMFYRASKNGMGLKYVGTRPLTVRKLYLGMNNKLIGDAESREFLKNNNVQL